MDAVTPDELELGSSLGRLRGSGLVRDDGDRLVLTGEGRSLVKAAAGDWSWDEWHRLRSELDALPLPHVPDG